MSRTYVKICVVNFYKFELRLLRWYGVFICSNWTRSGRVWLGAARHMACTKRRTGINILCCV